MRAQSTREHGDAARHAEYLNRLAERQDKLQRECKRLHEENLRRIARESAARTAAQRKEVTQPAVFKSAMTAQDDTISGPLRSSNVPAPSSPKPPHNTASPQPLNSTNPPTNTSPTKPQNVSTSSSSYHQATNTPQSHSQARKTRSESVTRLREAVKVLVTKKEADVKWTRIELSDDEDWEKVAGDEGEGWEVLEP